MKKENDIPPERNLIIKEDINKKMLDTDFETGLTKEEAIYRLNKYGYNKLNDIKVTPLLKVFFRQFKNIIVIFMMVACVLSFGLAVFEFLYTCDDKYSISRWLEPSLMLFIVIANTVFGAWQDARMEKSINLLQKNVKNSAKVLRDKQLIVVFSEELVVGDIIEVEAGDIVPADAKLISDYNLKVIESSLTGESLPVFKDANSSLTTNDLKSMIFSSSLVVNGRAKAIVTATGYNSKIGEISRLIETTKKESTFLQKQLNKLGKLLGIVSILLILIIFFIKLVLIDNSYTIASIFDSIILTVSFAVASLPEGLIIILTIVLSYGMQDMVREKILVKSLSAVETLGSVDVICSDKTGTLTQNKMVVNSIFFNNNEKKITKDNECFLGEEIELVKFAALCTNADLSKTKNCDIEIGDSTELSILNLLWKNKIDKDDLIKKYPRVNEIPFDSTRKLMTTVHKFTDGRYLLITKGAPEKILQISENLKNVNNIKGILDSWNSKGIRTIGVSYKIIDDFDINEDMQPAKYENHLIFSGILGMIDLPRKNVKNSISQCHQAGVKVVMITGDNKKTAISIAKNLNIFNDGDLAIAGEELEQMTEKQLVDNVNKISVFARVSPKDKLSIVKAFQKNKQTVAMTGDGINDAPALKAAEIGCAMGSGTDVAKNSADLIMVDDNFSSIVNAVNKGRRIFDKIIKIIILMLTTNFGEIIVMLLGLVIFNFAFPGNFKYVFNAVQILWINLIGDGFTAIILGINKNVEDNFMESKSKAFIKNNLFSRSTLKKIIFQSTIFGLTWCLAFYVGALDCINLGIISKNKSGTLAAFIAVGISQPLQVITLLSDKNFYHVKYKNHKFAYNMTFIAIILNILVTVIPGIMFIFGFSDNTFNYANWLVYLIGFFFGILPFVLFEIMKYFQNKFSNIKYSL